MTFDPAEDLNPVWSPDGKRIAFSSTRKGGRDIYITGANGTTEPELILQSSLDKNVEQWSPDGKYLVYNAGVANGKSDVFVLPLAPQQRNPIAYLNLPINEDMGQISPNGKWIAYRSNESGVSETYVQDFVPNDSASRRKWRVSTDGGVEPYWRADGKELFYLEDRYPDGRRRTNRQENFEPAQPKALFSQPLPGIRWNRYLVSKDGQRFLLVAFPQEQTSSDIHVIVNWPAHLPK